MTAALRRQWVRLRDRYHYRPRRPTEYVYRYLTQFTMTDSARIILGICFAVLPLSMYTLSILAYQVLIALGALLLGCRLVSWWYRPVLRVEGTLPEKVTAWERVTIRFTVRNEGTRTAWDLGGQFFPVYLGRPRSLLEPKASVAITEPQWRDLYTTRGSLRVQQEEVVVDALPPGASAEISLDAVFTRRGTYEVPAFRFYSEFPFNILRTRPRIVNDPQLSGTVTALPGFIPAEGIKVPVSRNYQPGGISLTSDIGESPEYIGSRVYREGDNVRRLDFRAWARHGEPVVREYQEEYYCRVVLILDTHVPRREGDDALEGAIRMAAAVADALSNGEYIIDLFAAGPDLYVFRSGRHTAHFENILEILACIEGNPKETFDEIGPSLRNEIDNISTALFVFTDWSESRERLVRMSLEAGCNAKAYVVRDGDPTLPIAGLEDLVPSTMVFTPEQVRRGSYGEL